ncbi:MAG: hypothetical protein II527_02980 [Bacteroidales bacterium]|nr:hypothetical protein [Bacteroidales bacterium]MBQ4197907.1 hypothetical protein [Bacteroidales bacterium]
MKACFLTVSTVCLAILAGCKGKTNEVQVTETDSTQVSAVQAPEGEVEPDQAYTGPDYAQEVLCLIDRSLIPERINDSIYKEATETKRVFDEYTSPNRISCMNGEGGIYNIAYVNCYHMLNDNGLFVLYYTEAGVDGAVLDIMKTYTYRNGLLTEVENPIKAPDFNEFFDGVDVPEDLKSSLKEMKREYDREKNSLHGLDLRFGEQDDNVLLLRPSYIADDRLWELAKPVEYQFNGTTFVKTQR